MQKSKLREYQDEMENAGWRIKSIPYDDPSKPMSMPTNWYAVGGLIVLVGGLWLAFREKKKVYLGVAVAGFLFMAISVLFRTFTRRRGWTMVPARCLDRDVAQGGRNEYQFRLRCQFELSGRTYTVTPKVHWRTFKSVEAVETFLSEVMKPDNTCSLHVNPKNPLETELVTSDETGPEQK